MNKSCGLVNSELVNPGIVNPGIVNPGIVNPGIVNPGNVNPELVSQRPRVFRSNLKNWIGNDKGSAIVEFVVLAIPLFIPIFIYMASFASLSGNEAIVRTLARETLRAYVASENDHVGREVSVQALVIIATNLGLSDGERRTLSTRFECSENPCLSANGRIRLTVSYIDSRSHRRIEASAQEHISPWM